MAQYGETEALTICRSMFDQAALDLRVNTIKGTREEVLARMLAENTIKDNVIEVTPHSPIGIRMGARLNISKHVLFEAGKIEVQDEGSQLLAYLVAPKRGQMVADFCAGAGGKTLAIGALMKNTGRLYAFDISEKRLFNLGKRLKRSGLSNLHAQVISSENDPKLKRLNGKFDRVLVDAPCSGFGTLRRNPDLKWRFEETDIAELNIKQTNILARAAKLTKTGGRLIYATCSLLNDENEAIAEAFLAANPDFKLVPANSVLSHQQIKLDTGDYLKLLPHLHGTDGFFAAVFEKANPSDNAVKMSAEIVQEAAELIEHIKAAVADEAELEAEIEPAIKAAKAPSKPKVVKEKVIKEKLVKEKVVKEKPAKEKVVKEKVVKPKVAKPKVIEE